MQNLKNSFPGKSEKELKEIAKKFYRHFCDVMLEAVKHFSVNSQLYKKHADLSDVGILSSYYEKHQSVILLSFHYGNWEWSKFLATVSKHKNLYVYNPQRNLKFDAYFKTFRAKFGGILIHTGGIYKAILKYQEAHIPTLTWLGADQTPFPRAPFWTIFLNQETPFFPGPGRLAAKTGQPVLLQYMDKVSRGKYKCVIKPLIEDPSIYTESEILNIYARGIEKVIREKPEYYLWSHRRWKHKRPQGVALF